MSGNNIRNPTKYVAIKVNQKDKFGKYKKVSIAPDNPQNPPTRVLVNNLLRFPEKERLDIVFFSLV